MKHTTNYFSRILLCIFFLLPCHELLAQGDQNSSSWVSKYSFTDESGTERTSSPIQLIPTRDGGFLLNNYSFEFHKHTSSLLKIDPLGNPLWQRIYPCFCSISDIIEIRDGYIATLYHNVNGTITNSYILKLNQEGGVVWAKAFQLKTRTLVQNVIQTADGGYLAAFVVGDQELNNHQTWVVKLRHQGTIEWQYLYNVPWPSFIMQTSNKDFLLITNRVGVLRISPSGEIKTQLRYYNSNCCWFADAKRLQNGALLILARRGDSSVILKLGSDGNLLMSKLLYRERPSNIGTTADGSIVLLTFSADGDPKFRTKISKLSPDGNIVWHRQLQTGETSYPSGIVQSADGGSLVLTWGTHNSPTSSDWVLKLDASGNIMNQCRNFLSEIPAVTQDIQILVERRAPKRISTNVLAKTVKVVSKIVNPQKSDFCLN